MDGPWIKIWRCFMTDPTVQFLMRRHGHVAVALLVTLLTVTRNGRVVTPLDEVAVMLGIDPDECESLVGKIVERGILARDTDGTILVRNWDKYQQSESAQRVRRFRRVHPTTDGVTDCNGHVTDCNGAVTEMKRDCNGHVTIEAEAEAEAENTYAHTSLRNLELPREAEDGLGGYPTAVFDAWSDLGDKVHQPASKIAFLTSWPRDAAPHVRGIHSSDILAAISNFGAVIRAPPGTYWWTARIGLATFLSRHLDKFIPANFRLDDFKLTDRKDADGEATKRAMARVLAERGGR